MNLKRSIPILGASILALPSSALACEPPAPAPAGITIEPSVTCPEGHNAEFIRLSRSQGDPVDSVYALCRDPARSSDAWAASLERTRDRMTAVTSNPAAKAAVQAAFDRHIAHVRTGH